MTTDYHTAITNGAAANAATVNTPLAALDAAIGLQGGGANASASTLRAWAANEGCLRLSSITRNPNGIITDATVAWPDGSAGVLEVTHGYPVGSATPDTTEAGWVATQITTVTHADSSQTATITVTRDANAYATAVTVGIS